MVDMQERYKAFMAKSAKSPHELSPSPSASLTGRGSADPDSNVVKLRPLRAGPRDSAGASPRLQSPRALRQPRGPQRQAGADQGC
jgi:hypothetical protein